MIDPDVINFLQFRLATGQIMVYKTMRNEQTY